MNRDNLDIKEIINNIYENAKPSLIKSKLDNVVIGQDKAKMALAVAVYNHMKRIFPHEHRVKNDSISLDKSNILLIGPTGSGKTLIARELAKTLNVPFATADATSLTQAGYVGDDVENMLLSLIEAADGNVKKAEIGIIYVDEIDKIARKNQNVSITRDVSGEGVQQALLKIMEGTVSNVPYEHGRKHPQAPTLPINTKDILFIFGGAFVGLEKIIAKRLESSSIGFSGQLADEISNGKSFSDLITMLQPDDLINFGLIPEFVGRLPIVVGLDELNKNMLIDILTKPKNSIIKQYKELLEIDGTKLHFTKDAIEAIADKAIELKTGARGLRNILESFMISIMFVNPDKPAKKITITKDTVLLDNHPFQIEE